MQNEFDSNMQQNKDDTCKNLLGKLTKDDYGDDVIEYDCPSNWRSIKIPERCIQDLSTSNEGPSTLELSFNPTMDTEKTRMKQMAKKDIKENFKSMDLEKSYKSLFHLLWRTKLPCFDVDGVTSQYDQEYGILKSCSWKGFKIPCSKIFTTSPTDQGMCCSFNMKAAEEMFKRGKYTTIIKELQLFDQNSSFDNLISMPTFWEERNEPKTQAGKTKGLTLVLDAHSDKIAGSSVTEDIDGFFAIIGSPNEFPMTKIQSSLIRPGHYNFVAIKATEVISNESIKKFNQTDRNCIFEDETKMILHANYSQKNCLLEKSLEYVRINMKLTTDCMPWYFPQKEKTEEYRNQTRICDPYESHEFLNLMESVPPKEFKRCLPDCNSIEYSVSVTAAPFRRCNYKNLGMSRLCDFDNSVAIYPAIWSDLVVKELQKENDNNEVPWYLTHRKDITETNKRSYGRVGKASGIAVFTDTSLEYDTYDAYEKDIAMVTFFFESTTAFQFYRSHRMTVNDFISQVGGMLGLCMGLSLVSFFEIFYWFTLRLFKTTRV